MLRQDAIDALAAGRDGAISVAIMQSVAVWHEAGQAEVDHLDASRCMGSAASLALGLALAKPDRKVMVLDGDGSLLMQLGSLVTVAEANPPNYYHFVFANGVHESTGNQRLPAQSVFDWCKLALASGYRDALTISTAEELRERLPGIFKMQGPVLIELKIDVEPDRKPRWAGVGMATQIQALRRSLAGV
jgi:phosphonopyruvate decarboxylase